MPSHVDNEYERSFGRHSPEMINKLAMEQKKSETGSKID